MSEWKRCTVGDVCEVFDGPHATPPQSNDGPIYLGIPSIRSDGSIDYENSKRISYENYPKWTKRVTPQENDVVFSYEANLESYARIPAGFEGCLGRRMAIMRPDPSAIDARFLYYYTQSPAWKAVIASRTVLGATVNRIPIATFPEFPLRLPSLPAQQRIAGVLSAYDKLIENNRRQIKLLEEAAQRLYKEWFVDLRFPGHETTPIHNGVPEGWKRTTVGQSSSLVSRGVTPAYADDSNELVLGQRCVRNNLVDLSFARHHKPKKPNEKWLKKWDVLINSTGTGSLGRTAQFWLDNNNVVVDSHITIIRAQQREVAAYLGQWAFSNEAMLEALHTGSTGQTELPRDRVANCHILIPDNDLLDLFYTLIEPMTMRIVAAQQQIVAAREARDRLLPKLMSGEIEV
ncbi:MAG: restriction endonuclease subunit S [Ellagibacter isourolithinifaciens]|uniref:restriction endonuclease subunit S n=1 Tax=Ellagibacter isourolithinifaciens TaxID=2137581 RepID=UPI002E784CA3|nr:restriction endonuclease subunit S [Ellagibacter isourolithinifaciens]MEE1453767.1 restriction endonuclease subunit S [Ellagibacter isourolithinifaciens]